MPLLSKPRLLERLQSGIEASGWRWQAARRTHPFRLRVFNDQSSVDLCVYIWNVTHGGGAARPASEYRIQLTGVQPPLAIEPGVTTLLLGWSEAWSLFAAYDVSRHRTFSEASPSIQFRQDAIASAIGTGMSFHRRSNGEVVVLFRPELLWPT